LIPAIKDVVKSVNIQEKKMIIDVIEGLLEWNLK
jgi:ribosomal 30S subunit maturation factor RimM